MKQTRKILIALLVVATLLMSMATLFVSAASQPETLYLTPNANWKKDGARFAAYFFGNGEKWVSMTDSNGDGVYEVAVPTDKVYPNVIFCRMNPSAAANNWNNKWNQTADLTVPTDGPNHYTVKEGTWDSGGGTWSTFGSTCIHTNLGAAATCTTPQVCNDCGDPVVSALGHSFNSSHLCTRCNTQASFTVAGTGAHLGTEWDTTNTANDMTYDAESGTYTKVYDNVAAGSYAFKVARDHDWGTAYPSSDKSYTVSTAGSTVTITLKGTTVNVVVEVPHVHSFVAGKCECGEYNVSGLAGAGTEADPYIVSSLDELGWFRDQVNAGNSYDNMYIKLTADIDLAGIDWAPIGNGSNPFNGMFDGDNHVISNLTINGSKSYVSGGANDNYKGLFGYMKGGNNAGIKNITLNNAKVTGCLYVGTILGRSYTGGIIENCHVKGLVQVDSYSYAGGIVGRHEYSSGKNVNGDVMSIFNCTVNGTVLTRSGSSDSFINADYAVSYVGGIVGFMAEGNYVIDGCSAANVSVQGTYGVGGISGIAHYGNTISNAVVENIKVVSVNNDPTSTRTGNVGLVAGTVQGTASEPSVFENVTVTNTTGSVTYTDATSSAINANFGNNLNGSKPVVIKTLSGSGTEADPFIIADIDDLLMFRDSVNAGETKYNAKGVYVALGANIDLAGIDWSVNIGDDCNATFDGIFDGKGYTIYNLTSTETAAKADGYVCAGLFGAIYGDAVIKNLVIENVNIDTGSFSGNNVAAVVGFVYNGTGSIENVTVRGDINISAAGVYGVGVIVGYSYYNNGFEINNCKVVANAGSGVTAVSGVGGIIGYTNGDVITNCEVSGLSIGATAIAGGISGTTLNVTVDNVSIKDVSIAVSGEYWVNSTGVVAGCFADNKVNITNVTSENVTGAIRTVGSSYAEKPTAVVPAAAARIGGAYYTSFAEAIAVGGEVTLVSDITLDQSISIPAGASVVLNLNGFTITGTDTATGSFGLINNRGTLVINGEGSIVLTATNNRGWNAYSSVISNNPGGYLTVNGGTIQHLGGTDMAYGIDNLTNGKGTYAEVVINGGTIKSTYRAIRQFLNGVEAQNILTINGGVIEGDNKSVWMQDPSTKANTGTLTIGENAQLIGDVYLYVTAGSTEWPVEVSIAAGAVDGEILTGNVPAGYEIANVGGNIGVYSGVAKIGNTYYESLAAAFTAAVNGDEVVILQAGTYALSTSGKNITITASVDGVVFEGMGAKNMGGASVTFNNVTFNWTNENYKGLQHSGDLVYNNCTINGQVFLYGNSEIFNECTFNQTDKNAYNVWTYGAKAVEFNKCTFNSAGKSVLVYTESKTHFIELAVTETVFNASEAVDGKAAIEIDTSLSAGANISVDANTSATGFATGSVSGSTLYNNKKGNEGANNDITITVNNEVVLDVIKTAEVNGVIYTTIDAAISAAAAGDTVTIYAGNYTGSLSIKKAITVVGETDAEGNNLVNFAGQLSITADGAAAKFMNFNNGSGNGGYISAKDVLVEGCTVVGGNGFRYCYTSGVVTFKNSVITGSTYGIHFDGSAGGEIVIDGCTITGWTSFAGAIKKVSLSSTKFEEGNYNYVRFYQEEIVIEDCTFNEKMGLDVAASSATVTVNNCTVENGEVADLFSDGDLNSFDIVVDNVRLYPVIALIDGADFRGATIYDAFAAAAEGSTITLVKNIALTEVLNITKAVTIDGAGYTISQAESFDNTIAAVYATAPVTINNVTFDGIKGGAALRTLGGDADIVIDNCVFQNCDHTTVGQGLVRLTKGSATITNTKFLNNNCPMVITFNWDTAGNADDVLTIDNCVFEGNTANKTAVIYYVKGAGCTITNSEFINNTVNCSSNGATVYLGFQENCTVTGCLFEGNSVTDSSTSTRVAGAIFFGYEANISGNAFVNNTAANANGDTLGQICTSTYYECNIDLSGNYWGGHAPVAGVDYTVQHKTGDASFTLNSYNASYGLDANGNVVVGEETEIAYAVSVGKINYASIVDAIAVGGEITLLTDIALTEALVINNDVVLNLAGHTLSYASDVQGESMITVKGSLTINDSASLTRSGSEAGTISYVYTGAADSSYSKGNYAITNNGTLTINSGVVEVSAQGATGKFPHALYAIHNAGTLIINGGKIYNANNIAIRNWNDADITVNGGEIEGLRAIWIQLPSNKPTDAPEVNVTITGGTLTGTGVGESNDNKLAIYSYSYGQDMQNVTLNISGGTFNGDIALTGGSNKTNVESVTITGGTFNGKFGDVYTYADDVKGAAAISITGGTFSSNVPEIYAEDDGYTFVQNAEGTYSLIKTTSAAPSIGENGNWFIGDVDTGVKAEGVDGHTPVIEITNGNWHIDGVDTGVKAQGEAGHSPVITIGANNNWYIDGVDTGVTAKPVDGVDGKTPEIVEVGGVKYWFIDGVNTNVKAEGADGHTPVITIQEVGGVKYWFIDGVNKNVKAEGIDGHTPVIEIKDDKWYIDGVESGWALVYVVSVDKTATNGLVDTWTITYNNGDKFEFNVTNGETGATGNGIKEVKLVESLDGSKKVVIYFTDENITPFEFPIIDGVDGDDGHTPVIEIIDGYWHIDGENTGIMAVGQPGRPGADGQDGEDGLDGDKGEDGNDNNQVVIISIAVATGCIILALGVLLFWRVRRRSWWCIH